MAKSPSHKFGQIIGDLLEEIMEPQLRTFCQARGLYLDKKGKREGIRGGKKVSWTDKFGNEHDLDFVIEKDATTKKIGRPVAFIEAAWRRYTKHSRNKAQEIQGAILPIYEKYEWDKPFLGAILAGVFTEGSLTQMRSSGFEVILFPYNSIVAAFASVGINAAFDEETPDSDFEECISRIEAMDKKSWDALKGHLINSNKPLLDQFFGHLQATLDRKIELVVLIPLHGKQNEFISIKEAIAFVTSYNENCTFDGRFRKYDVIIKYSNGDKIEGSFNNKEDAIKFLKYIDMG
jgi:hypothetical protein